jgi:hypothetical protein
LGFEAAELLLFEEDAKAGRGDMAIDDLDRVPDHVVDEQMPLQWRRLTWRRLRRIKPNSYLTIWYSINDST